MTSESNDGLERSQYSFSADEGQVRLTEDDTRVSLRRQRGHRKSQSRFDFVLSVNKSLR